MIAATMSDRVVVPAKSGQWSFWLYLAIFAAAVVFFIAFDMADGVPFNGDTDDLMRAVEVRSFLNSGNWYDMSFPAVRMPDVYVTPWSRLVDVPYAAIAYALQPFIGRPAALAAAFDIWPPVMAVFYVLLVVAILRRLAPGKEELPLAVLLAIPLLSIYAIWEFSPLRIDHHSVQMLLLLAMVYGISRWDRLGAIVTGAAISAGVVIGLETLPVLAATMLALAAAWLFGLDGSRRMLQWSGIATGLSSLLLAVLVIRPADYGVPHSDTFSAPFVEALVGFGVLAVLLPILFPRQQFSVLRFAVSAFLGVAVLGGIIRQYPSLLDGPFPMISGLAQTYWFDRIFQEKNTLLLFAVRNYQAAILFVAALVLVLATAPASLRASRVGQAVLPVLWIVMLSALLTTAVSNRFLRLALAIVPLMLPVALDAIRQAAASPRSAKVIAMAAAMLAVLVAGLFILTPRPASPDAFDLLVMNDCRDDDFSAIDRLQPGRISTPPALGLRILYHRSEGISVSSISFHRSAAAISDNLKLYIADTAAERAALLRDFDYLAVCRVSPAAANDPRLPLYSELMAGSAVPGLVPIPTGSNLMLYRVDHTALR